LVRAETITIKKAKINDPEKAARQLAQLSIMPDWRDQLVAVLHRLGIVFSRIGALAGNVS
jgi:HTH-type transcriptional regulator/antitoxin HigA